MEMNKDQVKGIVKGVAGKVQEKAGKLVGNKPQQVKRTRQTDIRKYRETLW